MECVCVCIHLICKCHTSEWFIFNYKLCCRHLFVRASFMHPYISAGNGLLIFVLFLSICVFYVQAWFGQSARRSGVTDPGSMSCTFGMFWTLVCYPSSWHLSRHASWHSWRHPRPSNMSTCMYQMTTSATPHCLMKWLISLTVSSQ